MTTQADKIIKTVSLSAPRSRVWRAITDSSEFGAWFLAEFKTPFRQGERIDGIMTHPECNGVKFDAFVEAIIPETLFSIRWHAYEVPEGVAFEDAPTTLVEFELADEGEGTHLTITESGFDSLPPEHRDECFKGNDTGWTEQIKNITKYVDG